jgi:hypothetical protein
LKTNTITDGPGYNPDFLEYLKQYIYTFMWNFGAQTAFNVELLGKYFKVFPIFKSSPTVIRNDLSNFSTSRFSIYRACQSLLQAPHLLEAIKALITHYFVIGKVHLDKIFVVQDLLPGNDDRVEKKEISQKRITDIWYQTTPVYGKRGFFQYTKEELWQIVDILPDFIVKNGQKFISVLAITGIHMKLKSIISPLGKLGLKYEPAGKVRVFAMVDPITQWALRPIHKAIFKILSKIPMDGTFDQLKPINRLFQYDLSKSGLFSFDLTAATDRLPIRLQQYLLEPAIGETNANHWARLLVDRDYYLKGKPLRYGTGQPMGALSSWAMLALTHHFIVQVSAWRASVVPVGTWFKAYALLGDDIVIAHSAVAREYLHLMEMLAVPINKSKSIISKSGLGLEFAKRTFYKGQDVSPIPFREFSEASYSLTGFVELTRKYSVPFSSILKIMGYGYRVVNSSSLPAYRLKGRYKWVKVMITFPTNRDELLTWVNNVYSEALIWSLLDREYRLLIRQILAMGKLQDLVGNEGFPYRQDSFWAKVRWKSWFHAQSVVVSDRVTEKLQLLKVQILGLEELISEFNSGRKPDLWSAFTLMLKARRTISLLSTSQTKLNLIDGKMRQSFKVSNRNSDLWKRWIKVLAPRPSARKLTPVQL